MAKAMTRTRTAPTPTPMKRVVLDFAAGARPVGRAAPPAVGTERVVEERPPRPVAGACFWTGPVAGLPEGAGGLTAGWPSLVEPRPGRCIAMLRSFPLARSRQERKLF